MTDPLKSVRRSLAGLLRGVFAGKNHPSRKRHNKEEAGKQCGQCGKLLRSAPVKDCPGCGVVLHSACYEDAAGGYKTPGCRACRGRTEKL